MHIVDRRLNPGNKSLENRQRFLRRAKALVQGAVKKSSQDRDIRDVLEGGEVSIPLDGMNEPRFRREGGTRDPFIDRLCGQPSRSRRHIGGFIPSAPITTAAASEPSFFIMTKTLRPAAS